MNIIKLTHPKNSLVSKSYMIYVIYNFSHAYPIACADGTIYVSLYVSILVCKGVNGFKVSTLLS